MRYAFFSLLPLILILSSCGPRYQRKSLDTTSLSIIPSYQSINNEIELFAVKLTKKEVKSLFDSRGGKLLHTFKPNEFIVLTIINNRENPILLQKKSINLPLIKQADIAKRLYFHPTRRIMTMIGLGTAAVASTFLCGCVCAFIGVTVIPLFKAAGWGFFGLSGATLLTTPVGSYHQGKSAYEINKIIDQDVQEKIFGDELIINGHETKQTILAIAQKELKSSFTLSFIDKNTQEKIVFNIAIGKRRENNA
jgi:hypothetical protein